jgi:uncharacterized membrane protein (DUF4010 family)
MVLALGLVSGRGFPLLASALASVMVLALIEKTRIHGAIKRLGEPELAAALQFAVLALVILPLLPAGPYGPYDSIRPRALWTVVLLFSGLNFAGYVARRAVGTTRGYGLTGLIGGLVSSTAVTLQFARHSREQPTEGEALGFGVVGACTVLVIRVGLVSTALNPAVGGALVPYLLPVLVLGAGALIIVFARRSRNAQREAPEEQPNPLGLWSSLKMTAAFALVLIAVPFVQHLWGSSGVRMSAIVLGLTDMDALTYSMTRLGARSNAVVLAAEAIAVGILSNTVFKLVVALVLGVGAFRRVAAAGLLALAAASCLGLWMAH